MRRQGPSDPVATGGGPVHVYTAGFLRPPIARIMALAGWPVRLGWPGAQGRVAIWDGGGRAWRGKSVARASGAALVRIEDAFIRSVHPGRAERGRHDHGLRQGPLGLMIDPLGVHYDPTRPSALENAILSADPAQFPRARAGIERLIGSEISKYNAHLPDHPLPPEGYVLVIDQTQNDSSLGGADRAAFLRMLAKARADHPDAAVVLRAHPETSRGLRLGHFTPADLRPGDYWCDGPVSPWRLLKAARAVYVWSSQLGYEAMLAGHRPHVFGGPFYAGWGLSHDEQIFPRRRPMPVEALFSASHLNMPVWYDPCRDRLCSFEAAMDQIEAEAAVWRSDHAGHVAYGFSRWKRPAMRRFFGSGQMGLRFTDRLTDKATMAWASKLPADYDAPILRVEDGLVRSRGLGAKLVEPLSLMLDDKGIAFDPHRESRLERNIAAPLRPDQSARAQALRHALLSARISKYNLTAAPPALPPRSPDQRRILVPGQVGDDASLKLGATGPERDNAALLARVRRENPSAFIIYKPHPDVEAGLRSGAIAASEADWVAHNADPLALLDEVDEVWTLTSTLGFEAILRDVPVTTLGAPFYAGWGLTRDLGPVPARRGKASLDQLVYAALIASPRYLDPVSGLICPPEIAIDRLANPEDLPRRRSLRAMAWLQKPFLGAIRRQR